MARPEPLIILDNVPQLIWSTRADGYTDFYNRRWLEYVGASFEQIEGGGWLDFVHPDDRAATRKRWDRAVQGGEPYEVEYRLRRHDSEYRWVLARGLPMRESSGAIVRWFGACTEIDDQKKAEQLREASLRELEQVTRLKDEFLASASHELRTPLNAILGWARMQSEHPELAPRATTVIERNAKTLADLINDLLDMSRVVVNKLSVEPRPLDLRALVFSAIDIVRPSADAKGIVLRVEPDEGVGRIVGDPNRLRQVVWNVLSNAVKFTPRGGEVTVQVERSDGQVHVVVADTGKGMAAEFLPFVFDRFRQADGSKTRREGGLGLGLAIAKHIVDLHGGLLIARSPGIGQGSTFTISLPATAVAAPSDRVGRERFSTTRLDGIHVLVVDDEDDARELVTAILHQSGATADAADSVASALDTLDSRSPDIVLSDVGMPNQSGYDLACELRARGFTKPIVALTAFAGPTHRTDALRAGFDDHLAKPVEPARLVTVISQMLDYWRGG